MGRGTEVFGRLPNDPMLERDSVLDGALGLGWKPAGGRGTECCPTAGLAKPPRAGAPLPICGARFCVMLVGGRGTLWANCGLAPRFISWLPIAGRPANGLLLTPARIGDPFPRLKLVGGVMCETTGRSADLIGGAAARSPACAPRIAFRVGATPTRPIGAPAKSCSETRTALPRMAAPFCSERMGAVVMPPGALRFA